jgi:GT2 family glycosyltransferase
VANSFRVKRRVVGEPKVSVVVHVQPGTAEAPAVESTGYPGRQLIVAGGKPDAYPSADLHVNHPFPARALNLAADEAGGEYLAFVDARAETIAEGWIPELLGEARRRGVGLVGGKLLNPDGSLRHGGSAIEVGWLTGRWEEPVFEDEDYLPLVNRPFNFAAASAAFMVVRKDLFEGVGGFDDDNLPTAFYDLDLSFRLQEKGLLNVYTPHASMVLDVLPNVPGEAEIAYMWRRWWERQVKMLFYRRSPLYVPGHRASLDGTMLDVVSS